MDGSVKLVLQLDDQTVLHRHLSMRRRMLFSTDGDCEILDAVLLRLTGVDSLLLNWAEVFCIMRHLRAQRMSIMDDMHSLENRRRFSNEGRLDASWRRLDADAIVVDLLMRRLWSLTC